MLPENVVRAKFDTRQERYAFFYFAPNFISDGRFFVLSLQSTQLWVQQKILSCEHKSSQAVETSRDAFVPSIWRRILCGIQISRDAFTAWFGMLEESHVQFMATVLFVGWHMGGDLIFRITLEIFGADGRQSRRYNRMGNVPGVQSIALAAKLSYRTVSHRIGATGE